MYKTFKEVIKISEIKTRILLCVIALMFLIGILDALSVASIYPIINSIISDDLPDKLKFINELFPKTDLLVLTLSIFSALFFLKSIINYLFLSFYFNVLYNSQKNLTNRVFKSFICSDYEFEMHSKVSEKLRNVHFGSQLMKALHIVMSIFFEFLNLFSFLLLTILFFNFQIFLIILIFLLIIYFIFYFLRKKIKTWGKNYTKTLLNLNKSMIDTFSSYKEIKVYKNEAFFFENFLKLNSFFTKISRSKSIADSLPGIIIELFLVILICLILLYSVKILNMNLDTLFPFIAMFSVLVLKTMKSSITITNFLNQFSFVKSQVDILNEVNERYKKMNLDDVDLKTLRKTDFEKFNKIEFKDVAFSYISNDKTLDLKNLNLKIFKNEFIGISGKSGSGKTTILNLVIGFLKPNKGQILYNDKILNNLFDKFRISYLSQSTFLLDASIKSNICVGINENEIDYSKLKKVIKDSELESFVSDKKEGLEFIVGENGRYLSEGQKQRLGLARALYYGPDILILDEPTSSLDVLTEGEIINSINKLKGKKTIILISHEFRNLDKCDKIIKLENGVINVINN